MTPQERLQLEEQHRQNLIKLIGNREIDANHLIGSIRGLWYKYLRTLLKDSFSTAVDEGLTQKQVFVVLSADKNKMLKVAANSEGPTEWERLMPDGCKHYWILQPSHNLRAFIGDLDRRLSADISNWVQHVAQRANGREAQAVARNLNRFRNECGFTQETLAELLGLSLDTIKSHTRRQNPKRPNVENMKEYAILFSDKLDRQITIDDLTRQK
jgi:DNA-binding XRE family transcriptional regulator